MGKAENEKEAREAVKRMDWSKEKLDQEQRDMDKREEQSKRN